MKNQTPFKTCPNCGFAWNNREDFLIDDDVVIVGYQVHFKNLRAGIFLFNHSCKGTFALEVSSFEDLYDGPVFEKRATRSIDCNGYCLRKESLDPCAAECECAFVREIIQLIRNRGRKIVSQ